MSVGDLGWWPKFETEDGVRRFRLYPRRRPHSRWLRVAVILGIVLLAVACELRWSWLQAKLLANLSARMHYQVKAGASSSIAVAPTGPYDRRLGYALLPSLLSRLDHSYRITEQASSSNGLKQLTTLGGYPVYAEKSQGGLQILDRNDQPIFAARYPKEIYGSFDDIPPLVVKTLLYIENRKVLDDDYPYSNPALEWHRLARAVGDLALNKVYPPHPISGGSTLATQLEKVRHSPDGRTSATGEKFRQMFAASLRAYRNGEDTTLTRREIVRDYINSFPLGAVPGYGEVAGLQEGLFVWFGSEPAEVNRLLTLSDEPSDKQTLEEQALAYREVLSLLLALNRPSHYLRDGKPALDARVDGYLHLFASNGTISTALSDAALAARTSVKRVYATEDKPWSGDKGTLSLRSDLLSILGVTNTYALDRMDLSVTSTFDGSVQGEISKELHRVSVPAYAAEAGLVGQNLLSADNDGSAIFSFTLYERGPDANLLRIETDNNDQPLNINRGTRLELGSTAKLRTLVTYLEIVADLHRRFGQASQEELIEARANAKDRISSWALEYLQTAEDRGLTAMLEAALDREYSANTGERFYTGGGLHEFSNFNSADDRAIMPLRQAFRNSVNLVFIRLMRDVEEYYAWRVPSGSPAMLQDANDPRRRDYLTRFADQESRTFLAEFWKKYQGQLEEQGLGSIASKFNGNLKRLTVIYRAVYPHAAPADLAAFLRKFANVSVDDAWAQELYAKYAPDRFNWNDLGYLSSLHPLELWTLRFRQEHPDDSFPQAVDASRAVRREIYEWLFQKKNFAAQNLRIGSVLERDAFQQILASWKRQGYPFADIVPSYASALGSSGDNPAALAELAGILLNDGVRKPNLRLRTMHFAQGTPYETLLESAPSASQQVYPPELARAVKKAMVDVVEHGTAHRAFGSIAGPDESIAIGGKTGTGDNRVEIRGRGGILVGSRSINRTATFVFLIGDRFFGTVTAYVPGTSSDNYSFTSALPVQLFRRLAPKLKPLIDSAMLKTSAAENTDNTE